MVRLKIYLALDEQTEQFCRKVNAQVRRITESAIVFSEASLMIPHITLLMGELVSTQTFEALTKAVKTLAQGVTPLMLRPSQPYIEPLQARYVLCDIQENPALTELRKSFSKTLLDTYLSVQVTRPSVPHLTLAHIDAQQDEVTAYLPLVEVIPQIRCTHIEISHVGPKGTSVDRLFALNLAHAKRSVDNDRQTSRASHFGSGTLYQDTD